MAWIESHQELARHPKAKKLARLAGVSIPAAIGHLHLFWWWAVDYAQDGELSSFEVDELAEAALWVGDSNLFVRALEEAGFVDREKGSLFIHDWDDYAGRLIINRDQRREQERERSKRYRERKRKESSRVTECARHAPTVPNQPYRTQHNTTVPVEANASCPASPTTGNDSPERKAVIETIVSFLNLTVGTSYKANGRKTCEKIAARLNEGFTLDDFKTVILRKHGEWGQDPQMCKYLRPETLFGPKFESYLNQPDKPPSTRDVLAELYHEAKEDEP